MTNDKTQTARDLADELEALRERQDRLEAENEELREQNEQLQQTVQEVQASAGLSVPSPSRRQLLKAGGASLAALAFGSAATGSTAAATGTIGGPNQRFDFYGGTIDANTVNTDDVQTSQITDSDDMTVYDVGDDLAGGGLAPSGYSDVSNSRSLDTVYQNTTGKPIEIKVKASADSDLNQLTVDLSTGSSSPPSNIVDRHRAVVSSGDIRRYYITTVSAIVPDKYYYEVEVATTSGNPVLEGWFEQELL